MLALLECAGALNVAHSVQAPLTNIAPECLPRVGEEDQNFCGCVVFIKAIVGGFRRRKEGGGGGR